MPSEGRGHSLIRRLLCSLLIKTKKRQKGSIRKINIKMENVNKLFAFGRWLLALL
jgi:hypothetical protein